jgi:hypothetical protein
MNSPTGSNLTTTLALFQDSKVILGGSAIKMHKALTQEDPQEPLKHRLNVMQFATKIIRTLSTRQAEDQRVLNFCAFAEERTRSFPRTLSQMRNFQFQGLLHLVHLLRIREPLGIWREYSS